MSKLHPPIIEGTIPAFYGNSLYVPFAMNKAVSPSEINGFYLKIKTIQSNYFLGTVYTGLQWQDINPDPEVEELKEIMVNGDYNISTNSYVNFIIPDSIKNKLNIGQYYKIQIAYADTTNEAGYYSTVGVIKYTTKPRIEVESTIDISTFIGHYYQNELDSDRTEKVYSYCFNLKDKLGTIIETSGWKLHDNSQDVNDFESIDTFSLTKSLKENQVYYVDYSVKTINGLIEPKTPISKRVVKAESIDSNLKAIIQPTLNYEDGCVSLDLIGKKNDKGVEYAAVGSFILLRASDEDNYGTWNEVLRFVLYGQQPSRHLWDDMTVKQGVNYKYAIQQYNIYGIRSNKIESEIVYVDFEHAYLYDGQRQLKIKYDPKITSFKNTLLENKVDTIGSTHPFIFRNGNVKYKEFPISGLISYLSDENNFFYDTSHLKHEEERIDNKYYELSIVVNAIDESFYLNNYSTYYTYDSYKVVQKDENGKNTIVTKYTLMSWSEYLKKHNPLLKLTDWDSINPILHQKIREKLLYENKRKQEYIKYQDTPIRTTNLQSYNIFTERQFKLEVLEWLTNGQPKLFRSPGEGNYIVRLLNVSLAPKDELGRMLHTFNSTAYEIAEYSYDNLEKFNLITTSNPTTQQLRWETIELVKNGIADDDNILKHPAVAIRLEGMIPGDQIWIDDGIIRDVESQVSGYNVVIGVTGSYIIDLSNNVTISKISFMGSPDNITDEDGTVRHQGTLTYAYYSTSFTDRFDDIKNIKSTFTPCRQFIGEHDILPQLENVKLHLQNINALRIYLRDAEEIIYSKQKDFYSSDIEGVNRIYPDETLSIYKLYTLIRVINNNAINTVNVYQQDFGYSLDVKGIQQIDIENTNYNYHIWDYVWYDGYNNVVLGKTFNPEWTRVYFNEGQPMDLIDTYSYEMSAPKELTSIKIGAGLICEIAYQQKELTYALEEDEPTLTEKILYTNALQTLLSYISTGRSRQDIKLQKTICDKQYLNYIHILTQEVIKAEEG